MGKIGSFIAPIEVGCRMRAKEGESGKLVKTLLDGNKLVHYSFHGMNIQNLGGRIPLCSGRP